MYNANYMEGVPVKIAEKYKPPPQIYKLPQSIVNKLNLEDDHYENAPQFQYDMQLERKALSKITEWKRIRQRHKNERSERKERRELQRKLEDEQKQKNLLCSVSYPSTDDLSSSENEGDDKVQPSTNTKALESSQTLKAIDGHVRPDIGVSDTPSSFHNILQPTVLSNATASNCTATNSNSKGLYGLTHSQVKASSSSAFNYKDFEDDTSSPFDNIELKTINDLDVLAQVLHNTQLKAEMNENDIPEFPNSSPPDTNNEDIVKDSSENHVAPVISNAPSTIPKQNLPKFPYDLGGLNNAQEAQFKINSYAAGQAYSNAAYPISLSPHNFNAQGQGYFHPPPLQQQLQHQGLISSNTGHQQYNVIHSNANDNDMQQASMGKHKSVPDILKELREEIRNSEMRRTRNCSQNLENENSSQASMDLVPAKTDAALVETIFSSLDDTSRQLAEQICSMGFPKQRVARIVQLLGADDKKIIEHLIPLSELADLGFEESKISEALMRHENNKNRALEDLIS